MRECVTLPTLRAQARQGVRHVRAGRVGAEATYCCSMATALSAAGRCGRHSSGRRMGSRFAAATVKRRRSSVRVRGCPCSQHDRVPAFNSEPTARVLTRKSVLIYHKVVHQALQERLRCCCKLVAARQLRRWVSITASNLPERRAAFDISARCSRPSAQESCHHVAEPVMQHVSPAGPPTWQAGGHAGCRCRVVWRAVCRGQGVRPRFVRSNGMPTRLRY